MFHDHPAPSLTRPGVNVGDGQLRLARTSANDSQRRDLVLHLHAWVVHRPWVWNPHDKRRGQGSRKGHSAWLTSVALSRRRLRGKGRGVDEGVPSSGHRLYTRDLRTMAVVRLAFTISAK